jgi:O-antigen/teichoic acid export membrane protein
VRVPIADAVGVKKFPWAAAIGVPLGCLWLWVSILRGALQGVGDYQGVAISLVGEQSTRLVSGAVLAATPLSVTGAYLGSFISFIALSVYSWYQLRRYAEGPRPADAGAGPAGAVKAVAIDLWTHVRRAWAPIAGLIVIAVLQNIDIIAAKHQFTKNVASSYGATAVAAKVLIWVAIGAGFYLVPEVARRRSEGEDTRPVLVRALAIVMACAVPALLIFAFGARPLLRAAFGAKRLGAVDSLLPLGIAFTVLAATYLAIQYMLALKRTWFLVALGAVAVAEPVLLLQASKKPANFAVVVLAIQAAGAALAFGIALWGRDRPPPVVAGKPEIAAEPGGIPLTASPRR